MDGTLEESLSLTKVPPLPIDSGRGCLPGTGHGVIVDADRSVPAPRRGVGACLSSGRVVSIPLTELPFQSIADEKVRPDFE